MVTKEKKTIRMMTIYLIIACVLPFSILTGIPTFSAMSLSVIFFFFSITECAKLNIIWNKTNAKRVKAE